MKDIGEKYNLLNSLKNGLKKLLILFIPFLIVATSFYQCANIQRPTGGPKDSIPPKVLTEKPTNLRTNFTEKEIVIEFDEYVRLENQQKEISYSPDMPKSPQYIIRKKSLHIELPDSLEQETTYVLNFGKAIVDNNERNALVDYKYVFSTGSKIDSLNISGRVVNALTSMPEKEISVILIPIEQDSLFGNKKANIFTITDTTGNFKISYLKENQYRIYALKESNNDRIYNSPTEGIAFIKDSINLQTDTGGIELYLSVPIPTEFKILDRKLENTGKISAKFNQPLQDPSIRINFPENLDTSKIVRFNPNKDSVSVWVENLEFDSIRLTILDQGTIEKESFTIRKSRNQKINNEIILTDNIAGTNKVDRTQHLEFTSSTPIKTIDRSKINLQEDSVTRTNYQLLKDSTNDFKFIIRYNWKEKRTYTLEMDTGAFIGNFGEQSMKVSKTFTYDENEKYGDIKLKINIPDTTQNYIIELLTDLQDQVLRTDIIEYKAGIKEYVVDYKKYPEGKYKIRVIYDRNKNGKWDPGILETNIQPELGWVYNKTLTIRPNWEQEEILTIPPSKIKE